MRQPFVPTRRHLRSPVMEVSLSALLSCSLMAAGFAVTFHRKRRQMRDRQTELLEIPGVGARTTKRLLQHFGSLQAVKDADLAALTAVVNRAQADAILRHFRKDEAAPAASEVLGTRTYAQREWQRWICEEIQRSGCSW